MFIDVLMANRTTLRVCPSEDLPELQVVAKLRSECFLDSDPDNVLFAYGARPNFKLTVLGLITSMPGVGGPTSDPFAGRETHRLGSSDDAAGLEKAFADVNRGMEEIQSLVRFSQYPRVTVYPLAVFRRIRAARAGGKVPPGS